MKNQIPKTIKIKNCRLCQSLKLKLIFDYGNLYVSNFVSKRNVHNGIKAPLKLLICKKCTLLQLSYFAPQEPMYKKFYWYRSGVTQTMKDSLLDIYKSVSKLNILKKKDAVLDIGANDGTMLSFFNKKYITIGCEPA
jgi:NDP-4-keto-2,6-dideoxyhexose 3-C-methyltransferase